MIRRISTLIDAFRPADGPPPRTLGAFFLWALSGAWGWMAVAGVLSALAGTAEVVTALLLGMVVDSVVGTSAGAYFSDNLPLLIGTLLFFLILRPVMFGLSSASNSIMVAPNVNPMVLMRLHRWTLGQAVTFDNDFAGRIAQADGPARDRCRVGVHQRHLLRAGLAGVRRS